MASERLLVHELRGRGDKMRGAAYRLQRGATSQRDRQQAADNAAEAVRDKRPAKRSRIGTRVMDAIELAHNWRRSGPQIAIPVISGSQSGVQHIRGR